MDRIETGEKALLTCVVLAFAAGGCSGGIALAGGDDDRAPDALPEVDAAEVAEIDVDAALDEGIAEADATEAADVDVDGVPDDGIADAPDTGDGDTCPADVFSDGRCTTDGTTCRTDTFCQQCGFGAWTWYAAYCWCAGGSWACTHADCFPPYSAGTYSDPACMVPWGGESDVDADADPDADAGADADADVGDCVPPCPSGLTCYYGVCVPTGADADADADGDGLVECAGGWHDPTSGLCWQDPSGDVPLIWDDAMAYCDGLSLGGHGSGSWHLPSIDELRSLIRGCPGTTTGGGCDVTGSCLDVSCWSDPCTGCSNFGGPGEGGCYWDAALAGECNSHWSSSSYSGDDSFAWSVAFYGGYVHNYEKVFSGYVRCVRPGP